MTEYPALLDIDRSALKTAAHELEVGEKVMIFGQGKLVRRVPIPKIMAFMASPLLFLWILFKLPRLLIPVVGGVSFNFLLVAILFFLFVKGLRIAFADDELPSDGWFLLTNDRLLCVTPDSVVLTVAPRSDVTRVQSGNGRVRIAIAVDNRRKECEYQIVPVTGLPEIVGGCETKWLTDK